MPIEKIKIGAQGFVYPMPVVLVGAVVDGRVNYITVAWVTRTNHTPPMIGIALNKSRFTSIGIREHKEFGVSIPPASLAAATDYAGMVSGAKADKSGIFESFYGELKHAPMIKECPVTMECRLLHVIEQPTHEFMIAKIINTYANSDMVSEGKIVPEMIDAFSYSMADAKYRRPGAEIGKAWAIGKDFKPKI